MRNHRVQLCYKLLLCSDTIQHRIGGHHRNLHFSRILSMLRTVEAALCWNCSQNRATRISIAQLDVAQWAEGICRESKQTQATCIGHVVPCRVNLFNFFCCASPFDSSRGLKMWETIFDFINVVIDMSTKIVWYNLQSIRTKTVQMQQWNNSSFRIRRNSLFLMFNLTSEGSSPLKFLFRH